MAKRSRDELQATLGEDCEETPVDVGRLYELRRQFVFKTLLGFTRDPGVAEELTQESFFRLYQNRSRGHSVANAVGWVVAVARNLARDRLRTNKLENAYDDETWQIFVEEYQDDAPSPEELVAEAQIQAMMRSTIKILPPRQRMCVALYAQDFSFKEIAEELRIPYHQALLETQRGILKMKRLLSSAKNR